jgi:mannose-6-phosphate isomerase-like protein (cupin superfamily)
MQRGIENHGRGDDMKDLETSRAEDAVPEVDLTDDQRRRLLALLPTAAAALLLGGQAAADTQSVHAPRRALTGRDDAGKSVFKSFDVTPQVVTFESRPGVAFHELYATDGVPPVSGHEPDPMLTKTGAFPGPGASLFRLVQFAPRPPEGAPPDPAAYRRFLDELAQKIPGMAEHFEPDVPGMHTSDTVDYGIVIRGEMILELDDGKTVHLRQGDCVVQNGTRHRWRNPLPEPCLMAFVLIGGKREV